MMQLQSRIPKAALGHEEQYEFLENEVYKRVIRMDELHPSEDNDGHFLFLIWVKPDDTFEVRKAIQKNLNRQSRPDDWNYKILPDTGEGLIILSTWI